MNPTETGEPGVTALLASLTEIDPVALARLHDGLAAAAEREGSLDIAYTTIDSPIGRLLIAATPLGLLRVAFESEGLDDVLGTLATRVSPRILEAPNRLESAARELDEYFAGQRRRFDLPLDFGLSTGFRQTVQRQLSSIGYGTTQSYGQIAASVGNPQAVRAVGSACATNPLPIVIPCHRVIRTDGSLGGYAGGLEAKTTLLRLEAAA